MQDFDSFSDTLGQNVASSVWITLRPDTPAGIGLGGSRSLGPGETGLVPRVLAERLVRNGKATYAVPPAPPAPAPTVVQVDDPAPATRDPEPARVRGKRRRERGS